MLPSRCSDVQVNSRNTWHQWQHFLSPNHQSDKYVSVALTDKMLIFNQKLLSRCPSIQQTAFTETFIVLNTINHPTNKIKLNKTSLGCFSTVPTAASLAEQKWSWSSSARSISVWILPWFLTLTIWPSKLNCGLYLLYTKIPPYMQRIGTVVSLCMFDSNEDAPAVEPGVLHWRLLLLDCIRTLYKKLLHWRAPDKLSVPEVC